MIFPVYFDGLCCLESVCCRDHIHHVLRGTQTVFDETGKKITRNRTAGAGTYPCKMCKVWAQTALASAPRSAWASGLGRRDEELCSSLGRLLCQRRQSGKGRAVDIDGQQQQTPDLSSGASDAGHLKSSSTVVGGVTRGTV